MNTVSETSIACEMNEKKRNENACVGIAAMIGGVSISVVALFAIFAPGSMAVSAWIVGSLCAMGIVLGVLSTGSKG